MNIRERLLASIYTCNVLCFVYHCGHALSCCCEQAVEGSETCACKLMPHGTLKCAIKAEFPQFKKNTGATKFIGRLLRKYNDSYKIDNSTFENLSNDLRFLSFNGGGHMITSLSALTFQYMSAVTEILITKTKLNLIEQNTFSTKHVPQLLRLYLNKNNINNFNSKAVFNYGSNIEELNLASNLLSAWTPQAPLMRLKGLFLQHNKITAINDDTFASLFNLQRLNLNDNIITTIHSGAFTHTLNLQRLILSRNKLTTLDPATFHSLSNHLIALSLAYNSLASLSKDTFSYLSRLERLGINGNVVCENANRNSAIAYVVPAQIHRDSVILDNCTRIIQTYRVLPTARGPSTLTQERSSILNVTESRTTNYGLLAVIIIVLLLVLIGLAIAAYYSRSKIMTFIYNVFATTHMPMNRVIEDSQHVQEPELQDVSRTEDVTTPVTVARSDEHLKLPNDVENSEMIKADTTTTEQTSTGLDTQIPGIPSTSNGDMDGPVSSNDMAMALAIDSGLGGAAHD